MILYTDHISSSRLADKSGELAGKRLRSDTPKEMPCIADVLVAMVYYAWMDSLLKVPRDYAKQSSRARLVPNRWSRRALGLMAATTGDAWRKGEKGSMARQPPSPLTQNHRWQQQVLTETFVSYFPEDVFEGFIFPYIEDVVNLPAFNRYAEPYFEYIDSGANWSDEISREGAQGNWAPCNAFSVKECGVAVELLTLPCLAVVRIFEFL